MSRKILQPHEHPGRVIAVKAAILCDLLRSGDGTIIEIGKRIARKTSGVVRFHEGSIWPSTEKLRDKDLLEYRDFNNRSGLSVHRCELTREGEDTARTINNVLRSFLGLEENSEDGVNGFDDLVLFVRTALLLALKDGPAYAEELRRRIDKNSTGFIDTSSGSMHYALKGLVRDGMIEPNGIVASIGCGRPGKGYKSTALGKLEAVRIKQGLRGLVV